MVVFTLPLVLSRILSMILISCNEYPLNAKNFLIITLDLSIDILHVTGSMMLNPVNTSTQRHTDVMSKENLIVLVSCSANQSWFISV